HTKQLLITCLLLGWATYGLMAQQGSVAAGGDAGGAGGTMSYSIGQTGYLAYSSPQGSYSMGLQQVYVAVPTTLILQNTTVWPSETQCFNATQTVTLAGNGNYFTVKNNGFAEIIAGQNILLKYGTLVEPGGHLLARISTNGLYCNNPESLLTAFEEKEIPVPPTFEADARASFFKVYPNPTTGDFTLELKEFEEFSAITVEIYGLKGERINSAKLPAEKLYNLSLADRQPGIYMIRVMKNNETGVMKILKK
ncbi:MAG: T9SS type A sorting domain-containing protein, partial [Candidatus Subteraquimicrobiales bacterium]|nr:T9SS type A sorting domain-containing protein [Candidatus Subteraquimicrobiales bacterium]